MESEITVIKDANEHKGFLDEKKLTVITYIMYSILMIVYEIGYCNASNIVNAVKKSNISYNFSLFRLIAYIAIFIIIYFLKKIYIKDAIKIQKNIIKRISIYIYFPLAIITILAAIMMIVLHPNLARGMSIGIITIILTGIFILYVSNNTIKNVILAIWTFGVVFSITTYFNHALDEKKHFMSAFNLSFLNFDYVCNPVTDEQIEQLPQLTKYSYIDPFLENKYQSNLTNNVNMEDVPSTPAEYSFVTYSFAACGIFLARIFSGSIIDIYIAGRIFNLFLFTLFVWGTLKLMPYKKNIFAVIFLMPMVLLLAASYSIDGFCIGAVSLFIAFCMKLQKEKEILKIKDLIILFLLFGLVLLAKSMAYVLVGVIIGMLPLIKTIKKDKKFLIVLLTSILVVVIGLSLFIISKSNTTGDSRGGANVNVHKQIENMMNNPIIIIKVALNHINNSFFNPYWYNMLHDTKFFTQYSQVVLIPFILFVLYVSLTEDDYNFKIKDKFIMIFSFLAVYGMTSMILYVTFSEVGSIFIGGYQTRYILPIIALVLVSISNKKVVSKYKENRNYNIALASGIFAILGILQCLIV